MAGGRTLVPENGSYMDTGTLWRGRSHTPCIICGSKKSLILREEGKQQTRKIFHDSLEFKSNYIDYNIINVDYWSTPFAKTRKEYRDFWVNYSAGRRLKFNLDDIPVRYKVSKTKTGKWVIYGGVGFSFKPYSYYKRCGFIYPDHFGEGSTPRLIDIATTIEHNHRQREKQLETTTLTFNFSMVLAGYAGAFSSGGIPRAPRGRVRIPTAADANRGRVLVEQLRKQGNEVVVNVGGEAAAHEVRVWPHAINLNPAPRVSGVPNLVKARGEQIGSLFNAGSVDKVVASKIPTSVDPLQLANGSVHVLKSGGTIEINLFGTGVKAWGEKFVDALIKSGISRGRIKNVGDVLFQATK